MVANRAYPTRPKFRKLLDKAIEEEKEQRDKEFKSWRNKVVKSNVNGRSRI